MTCRHLSEQCFKPVQPKLRILAGTATVVVAAVFAASALAGGGSSIGTAPAVTPGQQTFGDNSKMGSTSQGISRWDEYWRLSLVSGDHVRIDWEENAGVQVSLRVYSSSTTDFNVSGRDPVVSQGAAANGKNELVFDANASGQWPLDANSWGPYGEKPGPYDFVVAVTHRVRVYLPAVSAIRRGSVILAQVHTSDGSPISDTGLQLTLTASIGKNHIVLGSARAASGIARIKVATPASVRGARVALRVRASGANYFSALSNTRTVAVH